MGSLQAGSDGVFSFLVVTCRSHAFMCMTRGLPAHQASLANRNELLEKFLAMQQQQQQQTEAASIEPGGAQPL